MNTEGIHASRPALEEKIKEFCKLKASDPRQYCNYNLYEKNKEHW